MQNSQHVRRLLNFCLLVMLFPASVLAGSRTPGPFDALSDQEVALARKLLLSDATVKKNLGSDRYRILSIERREHPKAVALTAERGAVAILYNYTKDETLSIACNLGKNPGVEIVVPVKGPQPSLNAAEIQEAHRAALADPTIQKRLVENGVTNKESVMITELFAQTLGKEDSCDTHRCLFLSFNTEDRVLGFNALYDLSSQRVINR